jgi:two-component system chemotaxis response regulator CheY
MASILIVDDDEQIRLYLRTILAENGYEVLEAHNGKEALTRYRKNRPDGVILDIIMPEMEGVETIRKLKKIDPRAAITVISGGGKAAPEYYLHMVSSFKPMHLFSKPVDEEDILSAVSNMVDRENRRS